MRKEEKTFIYKTFNEMSYKEKKKAVELEKKDHHWNNIYCEMHTQYFDEFIEELKKEYGVDFELKLEYGTSYIFIKEIKFKPIYIVSGENELEIEIDHHYSKDEINTFFSFYSEDYATENDFKKLKEINEKLTKIKDLIYDNFKNYESVLIYGWDDFFEEWLLNMLEENDFEYDVTDW